MFLRNNKYIEIPMTHEFLVGMQILVNHYLTGNQWNCDFLSNETINKIIQGQQLVKEDNEQFLKDADRANFHFGKRKEEKQGKGELQTEPAAALHDAASLRLYSWLVSLSEKKPLKLDDALKDKDFIARFVTKVKDFEDRLVEAGLWDRTSNRAKGIDDLEKYASETNDEEKLNVRELVENAINWMEPYSKILAIQNTQPKSKFKKSIPQNDQEINLSTEEANAVFAFIATLGKGSTVQGGCIWGVQSNCFVIGWLQDAQAILKMQDSPGVSYEEQFRITRTEEGIRVSTCVEVTELTPHDMYMETFSDTGSLLGRAEGVEAVTIASKPGVQRLIKFFSEQSLEREEKDEVVSFTMRPVQQKVLMNEELLRHVMLEKMTAKINWLDKNNLVYRPADLFAMIPYLGIEKEFKEIKDFKELFCKSLAKQPQFVVDFALKWIGICYGQDNSKVYQEVTAALQQLFSVEDEQKNSEAKKLNNKKSVLHRHAGYLYDADSKAKFIQYFIQELQGHTPGEVRQVLKEIAKFPKEWAGLHSEFLHELGKNVGVSSDEIIEMLKPPQFKSAKKKKSDGRTELKRVDVNVSEEEVPLFSPKLVSHSSVLTEIVPPPNAAPAASFVAGESSPGHRKGNLAASVVIGPEGLPDAALSDQNAGSHPPVDVIVPDLKDYNDDKAIDPEDEAKTNVGKDDHFAHRQLSPSTPRSFFFQPTSGNSVAGPSDSTMLSERPVPPSLVLSQMEHEHEVQPGMTVAADTSPKTQHQHDEEEQASSVLKKWLTKTKDFILANPKTVGLSVFLCVLGIGLAASGVLAPLGVAIGVGAAAMVTPGGIAAVGAVGLCTPLAVRGVVKGVNALRHRHAKPSHRRSIVIDKEVLELEGINSKGSKTSRASRSSPRKVSTSHAIDEFGAPGPVTDAERSAHTHTSIEMSEVGGEHAVKSAPTPAAATGKSGIYQPKK